MSNVHVTGAARGIGKAIALRLGRDGHQVALSDLPSMADDLERTRQELEASGTRAVAMEIDVSDLIWPWSATR